MHFLLVQKIRGAFNKFPDFFVQSLKIVVDFWKFSIAIHLMRWLTNFYDFRNKWTATAVDVLRKFRKRFRRKRPALFKSGQWHFHQDNTPVHNSILVTDYLTKMSIKTVPRPPYRRDLAPCDFWLFPKLIGCRYETIEEMKEAVKMAIETLTQEDFHGAFVVVGMVQRVHCSRMRLLRRGLEIHVCTINKSAHTKKVWKLI